MRSEHWDRLAMGLIFLRGRHMVIIGLDKDRAAMQLGGEG
jgi:hypothetical protein